MANEVYSALKEGTTSLIKMINGYFRYQMTRKEID
jgi:hypothetical protein